MKTQETKRTEAAARQAQHDKLSVRDKLIKLDYRLGLDKGAVRERAKLARQLNQAGS